MRAKTVSTIVILATLCAAAPSTRGQATAPTFGNPTNITNAYAPFDAGSVKVFQGRQDGKRTTELVSHLAQTRVFDYDGLQIETVIVEEREFVGGALVEVALSYVAQDDAGNVMRFGEVSNVYENGIIVDSESDSWLVGGATQPGDPPGIAEASAPAMFMVADPQLDDSFNVSPAGFVSEQMTVVGSTKVKVPAGRYSKAIKIREDDGEDNDPNHMWVVPGVGRVKNKEKGARSKLIASNLVEQPIGD